MKNTKKQKDGELQNFLQQLCDLYPAEPAKIYNINAGDSFIKLEGEYINDMVTLIIGEGESAVVTPEVKIIRKYNALAVKLKHRAFEKIREIKELNPGPELPDMLKIFNAANTGKITEETVELAQKYSLK